MSQYVVLFCFHKTQMRTDLCLKKRVSCVSEEEVEEDALPCYIESIIIKEDLFLELRRQ